MQSLQNDYGRVFFFSLVACVSSVIKDERGLNDRQRRGWREKEREFPFIPRSVSSSGSSQPRLKRER